MIAVSMAVILFILIGQLYFAKKRPQPPEPRPPERTASTPQAPPLPSRETVQPPNVAVSKVAGSEQETVVENNLYRIVFSNRGAQAKSWVLKRYKDDQGHPLDLVNAAGAQLGLPLGLYTYDEGLRNKLNSALYVSAAGNALSPPAELTYEYVDGGLTVRKTFRFADSYVIGVEVSVTQAGQVVQAFPSWPAGFGDQTVAPSYAQSRIEYLADDKVERLAAKKISGGNTLRGPFSWAGVSDQYFAAIFLPENPNNAVMVTFRNAITVPKGPKNPNEVNRYEVLGSALGDITGITRERVFVGPKDIDVLDSVHANLSPDNPNGPDLRKVVDFGMFSFIARPLFLWLKWTQQHIVHNWGWAIIILTVVINLALLPLRISSMKSALRMQKLQPQMKAIQEKYKKYSMRDPRRQEMNSELAELYRREKVNPAGGCLPLLIQMPFLFAFYAMLGVAIELRQAPFLWLRDLSAPDKMFILPVLIVLSTLFMQKMTPTAGMDPTQQRMMMFLMPVMLGFFSWSYASGLSVYWITSNLIAMGQQYFMNRTALGREMRAEMEKRARKKEKK